METSEKKYRELTHERSEANIKYIAGTISEAHRKEEDKIIKEFEEGKTEPVPIDLYESMVKAAANLDLQKENEQKRKRKKRRQKILSRCAIALICVFVTGAAVISPADGWKFRFSGLFEKDESDHVDIVPYDSEELKGWNNYYIFEKAPEGYELVYAEDDGIDKLLIYEKEDNRIEFTQTDTMPTITVDNEQTERKDVKVKGKDAFLFYNESSGVKFLMWLENDNYFEIFSYSDYYLSDNELIELAENLKYVE